MPPIRPSGKKSREHVLIFSSVAQRHPNLSALAGQCVALGAQIESLYGSVLTTILGAEAAPAAAMYRSIQSTSIQTTVVLAAAKTVLKQEQFDILSTIVGVCNSALKARHQLAHWVWGQSSGYPDAIVLIDPKALLEYETGIGRFMYPNEGRGLLDDFDVRTCLVYDEKALREAVARLFEAEDLLARFRFAIIPNMRDISDQALAGLPELKRQPAIAAALSALEQQRQKSPEAKPRRRGRGRSA